jgi:hypothetical protein
MIDHGIINLKTPHQLFEKLQRDFARARKSPEDSWFNFFVTVDHLADWFCGNEDAAKKKQQSNALLRVVHRLSINGKHYEQKPPKPGTTTPSARFSRIADCGRIRRPAPRRSSCLLPDQFGR